MYLIRNKEFLSSNPGEANYEDLVSCLRKGDYNFAVFDEKTREKGLIAESDPTKTRILYNEETWYNRISSGGIVSVFQRATEVGLAHLREKPDPLVYVSRLGFFKYRNTAWFDQVEEQQLVERIKLLAKFGQTRPRLLFFGFLTNGDRETHINKIKRNGIDVIHANSKEGSFHLDISKKSLFEYMLEHKCFAALGMDGGSIGCWRDWELAMSAVPCIRHTKNYLNAPWVNGSGCYLVGKGSGHTAEVCRQLVDEMTFSPETTTKRLLQSQSMIKSLSMDQEMWEAVDAIVCNHHFIEAHHAEGRQCLEAAVQEGKTPAISSLSEMSILEEEKKHHAVLGKYRVKHKDWSGSMEIRPDGSFLAHGTPNPTGHWEPYNGSVVLDWNEWTAEPVQISANGFSGKNIKAEKHDAPTAKLERLDCVIPCWNYDDFLEITLPLNKSHFDRIVVVTRPEDERTIKVCKDNEIEFVFSDKFTLGGPFNMGAATNDGLEALKPTDWVIKLDADIVLPDDFRSRIETIELSPEFFYGITRKMVPTFETWKTYKDTGVEKFHKETFIVGCGYFQMVNAKSSVIHARGHWYSDKFPTAGDVDVEFKHAWSQNGNLLELPFDVLHLGESWRNWSGRVIDRFQFVDKNQPPKKAFIIVGSESSGNHLVASLFCNMNYNNVPLFGTDMCGWSDGVYKDHYAEAFHDVWEGKRSLSSVTTSSFFTSRSVPMHGAFPDIEGFASKCRAARYDPLVVIIARDLSVVVASSIKNGHDGDAHAKNKFIMEQATKVGEYKFISYESLVQFRSMYLEKWAQEIDGMNVIPDIPWDKVVDQNIIGVCLDDTTSTITVKEWETSWGSLGVLGDLGYEGKTTLYKTSISAHSPSKVKISIDKSLSLRGEINNDIEKDTYVDFFIHTNGITIKLGEARPSKPTKTIIIPGPADDIVLECKSPDINFRHSIWVTGTSRIIVRNKKIEDLKNASKHFVLSENGHEMFLLTCKGREDLAQICMYTHMINACVKPKKVVLASLDDLQIEVPEWAERWDKKKVFEELTKVGFKSSVLKKMETPPSFFVKYLVPRFCMGEKVLVCDDDVIWIGECHDLLRSESNLSFIQQPGKYYGNSTVRIFIDRGIVNTDPYRDTFLCAGVYLLNGKPPISVDFASDLVESGFADRFSEQGAVAMEACLKDRTYLMLGPPKYVGHGYSHTSSCQLLHMTGSNAGLRYDNKFIRETVSMIVSRTGERFPT